MGATNSNLSAPFYLVLSSNNAAFNGTALEPCTAGSYTALCALGAVANSSTPSYQFEKVSTGQDGNIYTTGFLQYYPPGGNESQLDFRYNAITDVAMAQLTTPKPVGPGGGLLVAFNVNQLEITDNYDDRTPTQGPSLHGEAYYRWLVCNHTRDALTFPTLNWQLGLPKYENPSCESIVVNRQFV